MKIYILCSLLFINAHGNPLTGEWTSKTQDNIRTDYVPIKVYCDKVSYKKGGILITYPQNYFSTTPYVYISTELNKLNYSANLSFSPIIQANTINSFTVFVNKHIPGYLSNSFVEADNDDVYVHIFSIGV